MDEIANAPLPIEFGSFKVLRSRKLVVAGRTIGLGSRAFDIITALIEARGTLISKEELIRRAWPRTIVDESNLHTQIAALRKALGKNRDAIKNNSGRGYRLVDIGAVKAEKIQRIPGSRFEPARNKSLGTCLHADWPRFRAFKAQASARRHGVVPEIPPNGPVCVRL